jgi:TonB family protein
VGLTGLKDLGGLQPGPSSGSNAASAVHSGQLDSDTVQRTVSRYTSSVKRGCWQPALDTRDKDAPTSARVMVTITVAPNGSVQNVSTSGDPRGYRGLANCIASRVHGWSFPPAGDTTTVNVPFVFAAQ